MVSKSAAGRIFIKWDSGSGVSGVTAVTGAIGGLGLLIGGGPADDWVICHIISDFVRLSTVTPPDID
jgi:hypothetical protein